MNEKLKAWEGRMSDKLAGRGCNTGGRNKTEALVAIRKNTEKTRKGKTCGRDIMRVTFHSRMDALTGWKKGDILDMEISGGVANVFRSDKGVTLCHGGNPNGRKYIRFSFPYGSLSDLPTGDCTHVEAKPGAVAFILPDIM